MFDVSLEMLRVVEEAAIASARTMGMGDPNISDQAAVEAMRRCMDTLAIEGTIVIGEGEPVWHDVLAAVRERGWLS